MRGGFDMSPLKHAFSECIGGIWGDEPTGAGDLVVVRVADFDKNRGEVALGSEPTLRAIPETARGRRLLQPGDLLLEKSGGGPTSPVGNVVQVNASVPAVCSNFIVRLQVREGYHSSYLKYVFQAMYAQGLNGKHYTQTSGIQNLDVGSYLSEEVWLPPLATQTAIADYLDRKTAAIDALIAKKELLIEELRKYQEAVISEMLQAVSSHQVPFKQMGTPILGKMLQPAQKNETDVLVPYLKAKHVQWAGLDLSDELPMMWATASEVKQLSVKKGDLLICEGGDVGRACIVTKELPENTIIQNSLHLVRAEKDTCPRYIKYCMTAVHNSGWLNVLVDRSTIAHLTREKLRMLPLRAAPLPTQLAVATALDRKTKTAADAAACTEASINELKAYRAAVIYEAVTGKFSTESCQDDCA